MIKKGFTLSELIITLSIIGIITAITIPSMHNIMPDKDKGNVLKVYKTISEINNDIFSNPSLYMYSENCYSHILLCTERPLDGEHDSLIPNSTEYKYEDIHKYPFLLTDNLVLSDPLQGPDGNGEYLFSTSDGISWKIVPDTDLNGNLLGYSIIINPGNPERNHTCTYDKNSCTNPGLFAFYVDQYGIVSAADDDYLTQAYLLNKEDLSSRSADLKKAKALQG